MMLVSGKGKGSFTTFKTPYCPHEDLAPNVYKHLLVNVQLYQPKWGHGTIYRLHKHAFIVYKSAVPSLAKFTVSLGRGSVAKSSFNLCLLLPFVSNPLFS